MVDKRGEIVWVSWERHQRSRGISNALNFSLYELSIKNEKCRYMKLLVKSLSLMLASRSEILIVMNPSIILASFALIFKRITFSHRIKRVIVDAHNVGVHFEHKMKFVQIIGQFINNKINKFSDKVLVTNKSLAKHINEVGGVPFILPDCIPSLSPNKKKLPKLKGRKNILFVCTYSNDEPYMEVIEAARLLEKDIVVYITGSYDKIGFRSCGLPNNVAITGYLSDSVYINYLHSVNLVIDLTFREDCMVCGAYEALAAEKPMVLSDRVVLREYFGESAVYTNNQIEDIAKKIKNALDCEQKMIENAKKVKNIRRTEWNKQANELTKWLQQGTTNDSLLK